MIKLIFALAILLSMHDFTTTLAQDNNPGDTKDLALTNQVDDVKCSKGEEGCKNPKDDDDDKKGGRDGKNGKGAKMKKKLKKAAVKGKKGGPRGKKGRRRFGEKFGVVEVLVTVIGVLSLALVCVSVAYCKRSRDTAKMAIPATVAPHYELQNATIVSTNAKNFDENTVVQDKHEMV